MNKSLYNLIIIQFKEFYRDPEVLFWALAFPIALAWVLGIAFVNQGQLSRPVGVVEDPARPNPSLHQWMQRVQPPAPARPGHKRLHHPTIPENPALAPRFQFIPVPSHDEGILAVKRGRFPLFVEPTPDSPLLNLYFDPQNTEAQSTYLFLDRGSRPPAFVPASSKVVPLQAAGSRYIDFLVPGLIALGIMNSAMWGIGWALIERRMKKLLRRMVATPMKKHELLLSYFFTRLILSAVEILLLMVFAAWVFKVHVQGTWPAFLFLAVCGNMAFGGIAILTAARTQNSQVGNGLLNAVTIPMMILSGIFFSYYHFPVWMIKVVQVLPLTLLSDALRKVFVEGAGVMQIMSPAMILIAIGAGTFGLGLKFFKWY